MRRLLFLIAVVACAPGAQAQQSPYSWRGINGSGSGVQFFTQPVVAEGRLFLRDQSRVLVYDIGAPATAPKRCEEK